jgi:hypothetical protein
LILCALMNLTTSAPSINLSISMLFRILHILSILTGPNIFPNRRERGPCNWQIEDHAGYLPAPTATYSVPRSNLGVKSKYRTNDI